jgi:hypothetical protein
MDWYDGINYTPSKPVQIMGDVEDAKHDLANVPSLFYPQKHVPKSAIKVWSTQGVETST